MSYPRGNVPLIRILAAAAVVLAMSGCGGSGDGDSSAKTGALVNLGRNRDANIDGIARITVSPDGVHVYVPEPSAERGDVISWILNNDLDVSLAKVFA